MTETTQRSGVADGAGRLEIAETLDTATPYRRWLPTILVPRTLAPPRERPVLAIVALEPHMPWRKGLLERRAKVYESTRNPRAELARRELARFVELEAESRRSPESRPFPSLPDPSPHAPDQAPQYSNPRVALQV